MAVECGLVTVEAGSSLVWRRRPRLETNLLFGALLPPWTASLLFFANYRENEFDLRHWEKGFSVRMGEQTCYFNP